MSSTRDGGRGGRGTAAAVCSHQPPAPFRGCNCRKTPAWNCRTSEAELGNYRKDPLPVKVRRLKSFRPRLSQAGIRFCRSTSYVSRSSAKWTLRVRTCVPGTHVKTVPLTASATSIGT